MSNKMIMSSCGSRFSSCSLLICRNLITFMKKVKIFGIKECKHVAGLTKMKVPWSCKWCHFRCLCFQMIWIWTMFEFGWFLGGYLVRLLHLGMVSLSVVIATLWQMVMVRMSVDGTHISLCIQPSLFSINIFGIYYCF